MRCSNNVNLINMEWKNLAPDLVRQRVIIEGTTSKNIEIKDIEEYLISLASVTKMEVLSGPYTSTAHELGYSGWIHWRTSGCNFYSYPASGWNLENKNTFFSVDCYTCKPFSVEVAGNFTKDFFDSGS